MGNYHYSANKLVCALAVACAGTNAHCVDREFPVIRVGLASMGSHERFKLTSEGDFGVYDPRSPDFFGWWKADTTAMVVAEGDQVRVGDKLYPAVYFSSSGPWIKLIGPKTARRYRGWLHFTARRGKLTAVDELPLEMYLMGVIPCEMPPSWHPEALKAQAIAARTYTIGKIGAFVGQGFDVDDTTRCHTYKGVDAEDLRSDEAVRVTSNQIIIYAGRPIEALYATVSGGVTADASESFNGSGLPYLRSIRDLDAKGRPYAAESKHFYWTKEYTTQQLSAALSKRGRIGGLQQLVVQVKGPSGRVLSVRAVGDTGELNFTGQDLRRLLGPDAIRSALFHIRRTEVGWKFVGKGWGHGVGMCQAGANGRANAGQTYDQILKAYYSGVEIIRVAGSPIELSSRSSRVDRRKFSKNWRDGARDKSR
ncbi:MAG: SpoIID/LytB domain-containing protein [Fimbriimonadales bacterium]